jgi:outer membrane protein, heavy metal efflux system
VRGAITSERAARASALALLGPEHASLPALAGSMAKAATRGNRQARGDRVEANRADVRALKLEAQAAETARRAAARGWVPELSINGGVQLLDAGRPGGSSGYVVGLELPLPLFQRRQGEGARAAARRNLAEARRAALMREANARLGAAVVTADDRRARFEAHKVEVLGRAEELRQIAGAAYRGGVSDLLALMDAERVARDARLTAIDLALGVVEADNELALLAGTHDAETGDPRP